MGQTEKRAKRPGFHQIQSGGWYKFSSYEMSSGCIRPKSDACLVRYDPWQARNTSRDPRKREPAPYEALIRMVQSLRWNPRSEEEELDARSQRRLLSWCSEYGLLGVLLHVTQRVELAPRWLRLEFDHQAGDWKLRSHDRTGGSLLPIRVIYSRHPEGWRRDYARTSMELKPRGPRREGELVYTSENESPRATALIHDLPYDLPYLRWNQEALSTTWGRYFPSVPEIEKDTHLYPVPGSEDFWRQYAEPLSEFLAGADALVKALKNVKEASKKRRHLESPEASADLNSLVAPISPRIGGSGSLHLEWQSPSLLASFAMMALLDLIVENARICLCEECGTIFVTRAYQSLYCSEKCRHTAQKRRHRARGKTEATHRKAGVRARRAGHGGEKGLRSPSTPRIGD